MSTIGITGGTGFVGQHLARQLLERGHEVVVFTRDMHKLSRQDRVIYSYWSPDERKFDLSYLKRLDAVIHLAGARVDRRWTKAYKQTIVKSRVDATEFLVQGLQDHAPNCQTLISASAIGYYGPDKPGRGAYHEDAPPADDFLAQTCTRWEAACYKAQDLMRTIIFRFGIVLGKDDGVFPQFDKPQNFGFVPMLGNGRQVISWIHIDDLCSLMIWALEQEQVRGIFNAVAPNPVTQKELMKAIAAEKKGLKLPIFLPKTLLKIGLGEMAEEALKSITVSGDKVQKAGFRFRHSDIRSAVKDILSQSGK